MGAAPGRPTGATGDKVRRAAAAVQRRAGPPRGGRPAVRRSRPTVPRRGVAAAGRAPDRVV